MDGQGRRHLPSWMLRPCTAGEAKQETSGNDSEEVDIPQKKVKRKKPGLGLPLEENIKSNLPKQCRARKSKEMYNPGQDQARDLALSNPEKDDGPMRKKLKGKTPGEKKTNKSLADSHEASEDELTNEDLMSIAQEYVDAEMKKLKIFQINSETRPSVDVIRSEKVPSAEKEESKLLTHQPLRAKSSATDPLTGEGSINYPISTGDPVRDMLDLLLGGLLKKSEEAERKSDAATMNILLDHELSKRSKNDSVTEVVPAMKKKTSLKDKIAKPLD